MNAEILREAAALIRKRAEAATPGPWEPYVLGSEGYDVRGAAVPVGSRGMTRRTRVARCGYETWETDKANAEHIAAADPPFMLTVADWLEYEAHPANGRDQRMALAVARAYLGGADA